MKQYLGIDFGGSSIKYGLIDEELNINSRGTIETEPNNYEKFMQRLFNLIRKFAKEIEGIAISLPGEVNPKTGELCGTGSIYCLENKPLKSILEKEFTIPVALANDANCAGLAEYYAGAAKGVKDAVLLVLGTGIGGAVIVNGKLLETRHNFSGEFGYMIFDYENMLTWEEVNGSVVKTISDIKKGNHIYNELSGEQIFDLYEKDAYISEKLDGFYQKVALGCYSIQAIFDPEIIIIGGAVSQRKDLVGHVERYLKEMMKKRSLPYTPQIAVGKFLDTSNIVGAYYNFKIQVEEKASILRVIELGVEE